MKKLFLFCGIAAMAFCSCSNDENIKVETSPENSYIKFAPTVGNMMSRAITTTSSLNQFVVNAYLTQEENTSVYIQNLEMNKTNGVWSGAQNYFWPHSGMMRFYSYSPANLTVNMPSAAEFASNAPSIEYIANSDSELQKDLLYAVNNVNGMDAYANDSKTVNVNFRHALSQIVFSAKNINPKWILDISDVTICNIKSQGTYTLPTETTAPLTSADSDVKGSWTYKNATHDYPTKFVDVESIGSEPIELTSTANGSLLVLPQTTSAWNPKTDPYCDNKGAYFMIRCKIRQIIGDGTALLWPSKLTDAAGNVAIPVNINWEEGKKYTYTFIFGEGAGYIPPTGTDGGDTVIPGSEVLAPIRISVDIDDFQTPDSTPVKM